MNSQTARRPQNQKSTRPNKSGRYRKQTARFDARRDGKPLIFGWGKHLSSSEKTTIQRRVTWASVVLIVLLIAGVLVVSWININVITPGLPITTVNGHQVPQSQYRKMVALRAQTALNDLYGPKGLLSQRSDLVKQIASDQTIIDNTTKQINDLNSQISKLPAGPSQQRADLTFQLNAAKLFHDNTQQQHDLLNQQLNLLTSNTIPQAIQNYNQPQIGNESAGILQDNEFIVQWLANQSKAIQAKVEPTASAINQALKDFKANLPSSGDHATSYSQFLSKDNVSDSDVVAMMTIKLRRDNMQSYLSSLVVSPTYQVLARSITVATMADAQSILKQLKQGADFGKLAKDKSVDTTTSSKGGYMDWLPRGQYAQTQQQAVVENWMFDPTRKINEISPILSENGSFHIVQILGFDPSRTVDPTELKTLQDNALTNWIYSQHALPNVKFDSIDQNMLLDSQNMPPDLPLNAPAVPTPTSATGNVQPQQSGTN